MGKVFTEIDQGLADWIGQQHIFFVSTAPLSASGHVNCSPKGLDSFRIINPGLVAYQDLTGSGAETIAHVRENRRITIMFCAFQGPPKIVRLYGEGELLLPGHEGFEQMAALFPQRLGVRAYIQVKISRVTHSCGYSIPLYEFKQDRDVLDKWTANKGEEGLKEYRELKNKESIDGLKALE